MKDTTQTHDNRNSREIQDDIRGARDDMDQTLDSLNDRLSPRALINSLFDWYEKRDTSNTQDMMRKPKKIARFVRDNPIPALLTGVGVAWLIAEAQSDDDEPDFDRFRVNPTHDGDRVATGYRRDIERPGGPSEDWGSEMTPPPSDSATSHDDGESVTDKVKDKLGDASDAVSSAASATRDKLSGARDQVTARGDQAKEAMKGWAAQEEHLTPDDLKSEVQSEAERAKNKVSERVGNH